MAFRLPPHVPDALVLVSCPYTYKDRVKRHVVRPAATSPVKE